MFCEIYPIRATSTLTSAFTTTKVSAIAAITFAADHNLNIGDIVLCDFSYRFTC